MLTIGAELDLSQKKTANSSNKFLKKHLCRVLENEAENTFWKNWVRYIFWKMTFQGTFKSISWKMTKWHIKMSFCLEQIYKLETEGQS